MTKSILLVDDDKEFCDAAAQMMTLLGYHVTVAHSMADAMVHIASQDFDHLLLDFMLPDGSGLHVLDQIKAINTNVPYVTLITGHPSIKTLMGSLAGPGVNYVVKPLNLGILERALSGNEAPQKKAAGAKHHFGCLIGESPVMHQLYDMIENVSRTSANVMLLGESGTGKEVVAHAIHNTSNVSGQLVATNCGAFARELIGSELFGHEKGAFTGAVTRKTGVFERADKGTLFLDEITEMPLESQPNLLRVLETGRVTRIGASRDITVNCRVISSTNRQEEELARSKVMREDLYFRLAVFPMHIPPLRHRTGDIPLLARYFLSLLNAEHGTNLTLSDAQTQLLESYPWPGNVRELRHTIHRAYILSDRSSTALNLPENLSSPFSKSPQQHSKSSPQIVAGQRIEEVERELIKVTLEQLQGNKVEAAKMLGISLKTLYNRLNQYEEEATPS